MSRAITIRRTLRASNESIWRALVDVGGISAWQADRAEGEVELGGHLLLKWPTLGAEVDLDVTDVVPTERLVLQSGGSQVVFVVNDSTVTLTHDGLEDGDEAEGTRASWEVALATLDHYLVHHEGSPRHVVWVVERVATTAAMAHVYFTEPSALRTWLTRGGQVGVATSPLDLEFSWGDRVTGEVLANSMGRDVAWSWREANDSVLVLRTLPAPFSDTERLVIAAWSHWRALPDPRVVEHLRQAVKRLVHVLGQTADA